MDKRLQIGCAVLATIVLFLAGCQKQPTVEEIVARVREVEASTEDAHAVLEISIQSPQSDAEITVEVWEKRNRYRAELLENRSPEPAVGSVVVNDGSQVWVYDPGKNEVLVGDVGADWPTDELVNPRDIVQRIDEALQWVLERSEVTLAGEGMVTGMPTYKLEFTPKEGQELPFAASGKGALWVDQERWVVLQAQFGVEGVGEGWMHVRSLELNTGITDERFHFEIPEGAQVKQIESQRPTHLTLDEARAQADFLLVPTYLPEGVTLIDVLQVDEAYVLRYDHSNTSFTVVQGPSPMGKTPEGQAAEVTVRGQAATLVADPAQENRFLTWIEDGLTIVIAGRIGQDEILKVAESLQ